MQLMGSEVKSIREGKANIQESFVILRRMNFGYVDCTSLSTNKLHIMHKARERKLWELKKLQDKTKEKGLTIVALKLFLSGRGWVKLEVGLAKGKKIYDLKSKIVMPREIWKKEATG